MSKTVVYLFCALLLPLVLFPQQNDRFLTEKTSLVKEKDQTNTSWKVTKKDKQLTEKNKKFVKKNLEISQQLLASDLSAANFSDLAKETQNKILTLDVDHITKLTKQDRETISTYFVVKEDLLAIDKPSHYKGYTYSKARVKEKTTLAEKRLHRVENILAKGQWDLAESIIRDIILRDDPSPVAAEAALVLAGLYRQAGLESSPIAALSIPLWEKEAMLNTVYAELLSYILMVHRDSFVGRKVFQMIVCDYVQVENYRGAYRLLKKALSKNKNLFLSSRRVDAWPSSRGEEKRLNAESNAAFKEKQTAFLKKNKEDDSLQQLHPNTSISLEKTLPRFLSESDMHFYAALVAMIQVGSKNKKMSVVAKTAYLALSRAVVLQQIEIENETKLKK